MFSELTNDRRIRQGHVHCEAYSIYVGIVKDIYLYMCVYLYIHIWIYVLGTMTSGERGEESSLGEGELVQQHPEDLP